MIPFPEIQQTDITKQIREQKYTVNRIFQTAESFFTSIGLPKMTKEFWERSMLVKPNDGRVVECHASAADLLDKEKKDFR